MYDIEPQTPDGKVLWHFGMSLDGYVAGPEHATDWMTGFSNRPSLIEEYVATTGAVLAGRDSFDSAIGDARPYGAEWQGAIFVLTHHPEDARPVDDITILSCPVEEAVAIALDAADGKNVEVCSADIGRQLLELGLIDEIDLHIAPILLGDGIRLRQPRRRAHQARPALRLRPNGGVQRALPAAPARNACTCEMTTDPSPTTRFTDYGLDMRLQTTSGRSLPC